VFLVPSRAGSSLERIEANSVISLRRVNRASGGGACQSCPYDQARLKYKVIHRNGL
jgi:hypothetical protein